MDFLPTNELPLRPKKVEVYLTLRAFLTTTIRYFCALAPADCGVFVYILALADWWGICINMFVNASHRHSQAVLT